MKSSSSVEHIDEVTKKLKVTIPPEIVQHEIQSAMSRLSSSVAVKGFRAGKAPKQLVEKLHGDRVRSEVASKLISSSFYAALQEHSIGMIGSPQINVDKGADGSGIEFTAHVSILPVPQISHYEKFKVEVPKREVGDGEVDSVLQRMREAKGSLRKLENRTKAEIGDVVSGELIVTVGDEPPSRAEPLVVCLGEGKVPKELEEGIVGMDCGTEKEIETTVSSEHAEESIRGKKAIYKFALKEISTKELPEADDAFAKGAGLGVETLLELRLKIRKQLEELQSKESKGDVQAKVLEILLEKNEFKVPQVLIDEEIVNLAVKQGVVDPKKVSSLQAVADALREVLGETALKRVRTAIIVDRIALQESITVSEEDVTAELTKISNQHNIPIAEVRKYFMSEEREQGFKGDITRGKVLELLQSRATVEYS